MKYTIKYEYRTFQFNLKPCGNAIVDYTLWEVVRPSWILFKKNYLKTGFFWIDENSDIENCLYGQLRSYLRKEAETENKAKVWKNFTKSCEKPIDK